MNPPPPTPIVLAGAVAFGCGVIYIGAYAFFQRTVAGAVESLWWLPLLAAFATALSTPYPWRIGSKALAGAVIGLVAHPVMWMLFLAIQWIVDGAQAGIADLAANFVFVSGYSLLLMGWLTIPAGAILGRWYARRYGKN